MVFLENVMHLGHILAADGLDDVAFVVRGMKAGPTPSLGLTVQGSTACQRILQKQRAKTQGTNNDNVLTHASFEVASEIQDNVCYFMFFTVLFIPLSHYISKPAFEKESIF